MPFKNFSTLLALAEAFIPALDEAQIDSASNEIKDKIVAPDWQAAGRFLSKPCTADDAFVRLLEKTVSVLPEKAQASLDGLLGLLAAGGDAAEKFTGSAVPLAELSQSDRTSILQNWRLSPAPAVQGLFNTFKRLVINAYLKVGADALKALDYPVHRPASDQDVPKGLPRFSFHRFGPEVAEPTLDVDVVIVGSGAGGGVVAARLARHGKKIAIIEKGKFVPQENLPVDPSDASMLYEGPLGAVLTADATGVLLAGSTWGGSTTVNYAGAIELPQATRAEWKKDHGISFADTPEFQESFDRVSTRMGVSAAHLSHNAANQVLLQGGQALGLHCYDIPQNTGGKEHDDGLCTYGCRSGAKQAGTVSWLADAADHGALCLEDCEVARVILDGDAARGVDAILGDGRKLRVNATTVVLSAGPLYSPVILAKSGIESPLIGKNLKVHPCSYSIGYFNSKVTEPWKGTIMSVGVGGYDTQRPSPEYGSKLITLPFYPGQAGGMIPWTSPAEWKVNVLRSRQSVWTASIVRDWDSAGEVSCDPSSGRPVISYTWSAADKQSLVEGLVTAARVQLVAGCDEIQPLLNGGDLSFPPYVVPQYHDGEADVRFQDWLRGLRETATPDKLRSWAAAHPQGTCRMGSSMESSVVDLSGQVWGYKGLYVADASLVPTATGVNPMLTTMALADWVAGGLVKK